MPIDSNDLIWIERCKLLAAESNDPHRKVSALLVDVYGDEISWGVNNPPDKMNLSKSQILSNIDDDINWKYFLFEHAERNAIKNAVFSEKGPNSLRGATMYCSLFPCADCSRAISQFGISRLVVAKPNVDPVRDLKWADHYRFSQIILEGSSVVVDFF